MADIYRAAIPFIVCDLLAIAILFWFPVLVTGPVDLMFR